jgi:hypothetical protein
VHVPGLQRSSTSLQPVARTMTPSTHSWRIASVSCSSKAMRVGWAVRAPAGTSCPAAQQLPSSKRSCHGEAMPPQEGRTSARAAKDRGQASGGDEAASKDRDQQTRNCQATRGQSHLCYPAPTPQEEGGLAYSKLQMEEWPPNGGNCEQHGSH